MKQATSSGAVESKGENGIREWNRVPGDILCRVLELLAPDMKSNYQSRLVCKHWNSSWQNHNWSPLWCKQGPWLRVYCAHGSGTEHHEVHEVWSLRNTCLFHTHPLNYNFATSSQGLVVGVSDLEINHFLIYNPLLVKKGERPQTVPFRVPLFGRLQVLLHVDDAARGIYKIGVVTADSTHVYDSVTGGWEEFKTAHEFLSQGDIYRACLLASRAAADAGVGHRNPFTSPGIYMMQYLTDYHTEEQPGWIANSRTDVPSGFPSDVPDQSGMFVVNAAPGRVTALLVKTHGDEDDEPGNERFMEVFVYELVETEAGDSVCWRRLGATRLLEGATPRVLSETYYMDCFGAENILVLQLPSFSVNPSLDKSTAEECEKIQPLVFNLDDRSWTTLNLDSVKYPDRGVNYIFKPNPLARPTFLHGE